MLKFIFSFIYFYFWKWGFVCCLETFSNQINTCFDACSFLYAFLSKNQNNLYVVVVVVVNNNNDDNNNILIILKWITVVREIL